MRDSELHRCGSKGISGLIISADNVILENNNFSENGIIYISSNIIMSIIYRLCYILHTEPFNTCFFFWANSIKSDNASLGEIDLNTSYLLPYIIGISQISCFQI